MNSNKIITLLLSLLFLSTTHSQDLSLNIFDDYCSGFLVPRVDDKDNPTWINQKDNEYQLTIKGKVQTSAKTNSPYTLDVNSITITTQSIKPFVEETDSEKGESKKREDFVEIRNFYLLPFKNEDDVLNVAIPLRSTVGGAASSKEEAVTELVGFANKLLNNQDSAGNSFGAHGLLFIEGGDKVNYVFPIVTTSIDSGVKAYNDFPTQTGSISASKFTNGNCVVDDQPSKYFVNTFSYNWALWVFVFITLSYFLISVFFENTIPSKYVEGSKWSFHPFASVSSRGSEIYTKKARFAQLWLEVAGMMFLSALLTDAYPDESLGMRLGLFPFAGVVFGSLVTYITGLFLGAYYRTHRKYIRDMREAESAMDRKNALDGYEKAKFQTIHIYYIFFFIFVTTFLVFGMYFMHNRDLSLQAYWTLGLVIWFVVDFGVLYILVVMMSGPEFCKKIFKIKGYWYDEQLHRDFFEVQGIKFE